MRPLRRASLGGRSSDHVDLALDDGWTCRVHILAEHLARVQFCRGGVLKEPRAWMIAGATGDVAWEGRDRRDPGPFTRPAFTVRETPGHVTVDAGDLCVEIS